MLNFLTHMHTVTSHINPDISRVCDEMISTIQADHFEMENNIASPEKVRHYECLASGDVTSLMFEFNKSQLKYLFSSMLKEAITEIIKMPYKRCAIYTSRYRVANVWVEIEEDDAHTVTEILRLQSRLNANYNSMGVNILFDIFEPSEEASIPSNFKVLPSFQSA